VSRPNWQWRRGERTDCWKGMRICRLEKVIETYGQVWSIYRIVVVQGEKKRRGCGKQASFPGQNEFPTYIQALVWRCGNVQIR